MDSGNTPVDAAVASTSGQAECYLIVYNVAKKHNIGTLARSATAFNVTKVRLRWKRYVLRGSSLQAFKRITDLPSRLKTLQHFRQSWLCIPCAAGVFPNTARVL